MMGMFDELQADAKAQAALPTTNRDVLLCAFNKRIADELQVKLTQPAPDLPWSEQQHTIFSWYINEKGHLVVVARAGTSKTTTIIEMIRRSGANATARTLHSVGFACTRPYIGNAKVASGNTRAMNLANQVCKQADPIQMIRLVAKLHSRGREIEPHARKLGDLTRLAVQFDCEPEDEWRRKGYTLEWVEMKALEAMEIAATVKPTEIDFADMIYLPVRNRWLRPQFDDVIVDETQDMNKAQLDIAMGVVRPGGRIICVGDDRQAIYAFRGADSGAIARIKRTLKADELKLTATYRCGRSIVKAAQSIVPDIEAGTDFDGVVRTILMDKLMAEIANGDFLLSRTNAPMVRIAMALIRDQRRARIAGRDIGQGLKSLIQRMSRLAQYPTLDGMLDQLAKWRQTEANRLVALNREDEIEAMDDKVETINALCDGIDTVGALEVRIEALFTDDGLGAANVITCSSVHRAKGLEANRVFVLEDTLMPVDDDTPIEELNIRYVAITRAKQELVWVR